MKEIAIAQINENIHASPKQTVIMAESDYDRRLRIIADDICRRASAHPIVLISGPSGSGKTTTACRLEQILDAAGYESHTLSMDDYYADGTRNRDIVDQFGNPDYESPERLDIDLLNTQLNQLAAGEEVELPRFNFAAQKQERSGRFLRRKKHELIIMEGIHALNSAVTGESQKNSTRIYLSVRTRICEENERLHPSLIRFARRLLRDSRTRGRSPAESFRMLSSIARGENLYIMPYKHLADYELDTFMPYELSVYRPYLLETVKNLAQNAALESGVPMLYRVLNDLMPMEPDWIPPQSLVREFIGGSEFVG